MTTNPPTPPTDEGTAQRPPVWIDPTYWKRRPDGWAVDVVDRHGVICSVPATAIGGLDAIGIAQHIADALMVQQADGSLMPVPAPPAASRTPQPDALANLPDDWRELRPDQADAIAAWWKAQSQPAALASRTPEPGDDGWVRVARQSLVAILDELESGQVWDAESHLRSLLTARSTPPPEQTDVLGTLERLRNMQTDRSDPFSNGLRTAYDRAIKVVGAATPLPTEQADGRTVAVAADPHLLIADRLKDDPSQWWGYCSGCRWDSGSMWSREDVKAAHDAEHAARNAPDLTPADPEIAAEG